MSDLSELEEISENDIIQALGADETAGAAISADDMDESAVEELTNIPEELLEPAVEESPLSEEEIQTVQDLAQDAVKDEDIKVENEQLNISSSSLNDLTNILSKLLNNKTIEITIKIKD